MLDICSRRNWGRRQPVLSSLRFDGEGGLTTTSDFWDWSRHCESLEYSFSKPSSADDQHETLAPETQSRGDRRTENVERLRRTGAGPGRHHRFACSSATSNGLQTERYAGETLLRRRGRRESLLSVVRGLTSRLGFEVERVDRGRATRFVALGRMLARGRTTWSRSADPLAVVFTAARTGSHRCVLPHAAKASKPSGCRRKTLAPTPEACGILRGRCRRRTWSWFAADYRKRGRLLGDA